MNGRFYRIRIFNWSLRATKCVTQAHSSEQLGSLLSECLNMTYNAVHYAEEQGIDNRKEMKGFYNTLKRMQLPSCYKVASIARACAVVKRRMKSEKRAVKVGHSTPLKPVACITSGFFI